MPSSSLLAVALVCVSVLCHVTWNVLSKRASDGGAVFVGVWSAVSVVLWAPAGIWALITSWDDLGVGGAFALAGAVVLHSGYFLLLQRGYAVGELSLVYPVARGIAPLLASVVAVLLLGERPSVLAWLGIAALSVSLAALGWPARGKLSLRGPLGNAVAVGILIAAYTVWDANSVSAVGLSPVLVIWVTDAGRTALLVPTMVRSRGGVRRVWRDLRREVIGTAVFSPLAYFLVLAALTMAPVTLVAPLREVSVALAVAAGGWLLGEVEARRRLMAAPELSLVQLS